MRLGLRAEPAVVAPNGRRGEETVGHEFNDADDFALGLAGLLRDGRREAVITREARLRAIVAGENGRPLRGQDRAARADLREWARAIAFSQATSRRATRGGSARECLAYGGRLRRRSHPAFGRRHAGPARGRASPAEGSRYASSTCPPAFAEIDRRGLCLRTLGSRRAMSDASSQPSRMAWGPDGFGPCPRPRGGAIREKPDLVPQPSSSRLEFSHPGGWDLRKIAAKLLRMTCGGKARARASERSTAFWSFELEPAAATSRRSTWIGWRAAEWPPIHAATGSSKSPESLGVARLGRGFRLAFRRVGLQTSPESSATLYDLGPDAVGGPVDFAFSGADPPSPPRSGGAPWSGNPLDACHLAVSCESWSRSPCP